MMAEQKLMEHLFGTWQENREIKKVRRLTRKHGDLDEWREFAESTAGEKR